MSAPSPRDIAALAADLQRQLAHWLAAARTFRDAEEFAALEAWVSVERETGVPLRAHMHEVVETLIKLGEEAATTLRQAGLDPARLPAAAAAVMKFRRRYVQVDTTLDFLGDAVNTRTSGALRATLGMLDELAVASMTPSLTRAGKPIPRVLVYQDKGTGASILRAGVRLWAPGAIMPVAAIKIVRHNLYRPTSLFHETGHQVAYLTGWTESLRDELVRLLADDKQLAEMWAPWASEIVADVFAFLHTGFASVAALYDVVCDASGILRWPIGDPHPVGWLRTALGCAMADVCFGKDGPWGALLSAMDTHFPLSAADPSVRPLFERSRQRMAAIARTCIDAPVPALGGKAMTAIHDPARVSPAALAELERSAGPALWTSPHWRRAEGIRILALAGLREAEDPAKSTQWIERARGWLQTPLAQAA
jgi:hypothetical protein